MSNKPFNKLLLIKNALLKQPGNNFLLNYQNLLSYKISISCNRIYRNSSCRNFHSYSDQWVVTYSKQITRTLTHHRKQNIPLSRSRPIVQTQRIFPDFIFRPGDFHRSFKSKRYHPGVDDFCDFRPKFDPVYISRLHQG